MIRKKVILQYDALADSKLVTYGAPCYMLIKSERILSTVPWYAIAQRHTRFLQSLEHGQGIAIQHSNENGSVTKNSTEIIK